MTVKSIYCRLPEGYRWATPEEVEDVARGNIVAGMVGVYAGSDECELAVPEVSR